MGRVRVVHVLLTGYKNTIFVMHRGHRSCDVVIVKLPNTSVSFSLLHLLNIVI
jgi:hypothetical protein